MENIYKFTHPNGKISESIARSIHELSQIIGELNGWDYKITNIEHIGKFKGYTMGGGLRGNRNNGATYFKEKLEGEIEKSIEQKEKALRNINFFVGGLTDEAINFYYSKMVSEGKIK